MIALGGPTLKHGWERREYTSGDVSMIALGGPTLKQTAQPVLHQDVRVSMIALGGPTLKLIFAALLAALLGCFNDSTGRAYTETAESTTT